MGILIGKLKWAGMFLVALALATSGAWALASGGPPGRLALARAWRAGVVEDQGPRDRPGKIYFGNEGGLVAVDPKTGESSRIELECRNRPRISPDGRLVAYEWEGALWVRELEKAAGPRKLLDLDGAAFGRPVVWSADGSKLVVSLGKRQDDEKEDHHWRFKTVRVDVDGSGLEECKLPPEDGVQDWSVDGRLATGLSRNAEAGWELYVMKPDGSERRRIAEGGNPYYARFSPDGKSLVYTDGITDELRGIWVVGSDGQGRRKLLPVPDVYQASACWSPDGKRIAAIIIDNSPGDAPKAKLVLQEVDGPGRVEFPLDDVKMTDMPDWR